MLEQIDVEDMDKFIVCKNSSKISLLTKDNIF